MEPIDPKVIQKITKAMHDHDGRNSRWNFHSEIGQPYPNGTNTACISGLDSYARMVKEFFKKPFLLWMHYNGSSFQSLESMKDKNRSDYEHRYRNKFSRAWIEFLVHADTPWKGIQENLIDYSPEFCNEHGFIFRDPLSINYKLLYNFLIASRFCWEYPKKFAWWYRLVQDGIEPRMAFVIISGYAPQDDKMKTWLPSYGDNHQALSHADPFVYRFTESEPKLNEKDTLGSPGNGTKESIFLIKASETHARDRALKEFSLEEILSRLTKAKETQRKEI